MSDRSSASNFVLNAWPILLLAAILLGSTIIFHDKLAAPSVPRACIVLSIAAVLLYAATKAFIPDSTATDNVRFVIVLNVLAFIILGISATILACDHWEVASLLGGASLLVGGFFGLLFGYPQGAAGLSSATALALPQVPTQTTPLSVATDPRAPAALPGPSSTAVPLSPDAPPLPAGPAPSTSPVMVTTATHDKNLLAESAATLGKVIAGFTLAKASTFGQQYYRLGGLVGSALGPEGGSGSAPVVGCIVMAYFLAVGFFAGLLLPPYFMNDKI